MLGFDFGKAAELHRYTRDFEEVGIIGSGGFSTVHKVKSKLDNRFYAMKIIKIKPSLYKKDLYEHFEKLLNEAKILASLSHPNVIRYYGCWIEAEPIGEEDQYQEPDELTPQAQFEMVIEDDSSNSGFSFAREPDLQSQQQKTEISNKKINKKQCLFNNNSLCKYKEITIYIQTELCQSSLQHYVEQRNISLKNNPENKKQRLFFAENYRIALDIIKGLSYIHSRKIIHRDLKLQNIMIDKTGKSKIIDFGLAKKVRSFGSVHIESGFGYKRQIQDDQKQNEEKFSSSVGTKIYSSPEQASTNKYDHRTDIYSLGMIIAILFARFVTVHGQRQLQMNIRSKKLSDIEMDSRLRDLLLRCLSQQKQRPTLEELEFCLRILLRQQIQSKSLDRDGVSIIKYGPYQYEVKYGQFLNKKLIDPKPKQKQV